MKTADDVQVTIRVNKGLKENAENLFAGLGMNMTTAINVFLIKAVNEKAIPFPVSVKSPRFVSKYTEDNITAAFQTAVRRDITRKKQNGTPVARYDVDTKRAYLEYPDGTREYEQKT